ncbi:MAG: Rne/Rng family ribonuclease [Alphaproteobacteria bacterium]|nr:Rne/Rng family ribonuclease [Alphaproteobacteria bacterium]
MTKRMLIDATHPEETRVAVISGNRLEEYDYENILRKQLKSNIYLVKVTRVEPSLQAAFVDFGGNRHGFLPFPEIHPDYYRIPIADREALLAEERALAAAQAAKEDEEDAAELAELAQRGETIDDDESESEGDEDGLDVRPLAEVIEDEDDDEDDEEEAYTPIHTGSIAADIAQESLIDDEDDEDDENEDDAEGSDAEDDSEDDSDEEEDDEDDEDEEGDDADVAEAGAEAEAVAASGETAEGSPAATAPQGRGGRGRRKPGVETVGGDVVETPVFRSSIKRRYKIQEVIKRNQIMLIQISKEERGNKGAAVTSYISLPGRYCVLMPNSPRGGGVSRKVSNAKDRQRLKKILHELKVPEGMSVILRTAGVARSKAEIKRDLDYLLRLWDQIREHTLKSTAPALIYEEGNLIKRAIRDLYRRDIDEVHVAGEEGFKAAKDFMRTLMPSHADRVHEYKNGDIPLFFRYQVESQIDEIHNPTVHLKSGGYIVINPTEALVSIDVNSGRATKGRHIEETAMKTNIEAAEEIARQLRLRDQGGLVVIDFIDMEDRRNNRLVERKLRDAMAGDRARIQLGRISAFGLLELSRQRLHPSLVETNFEICKHCSGVGVVRTVETTAVMILRAIEEEALRGRATELRVSVPTEVALYVFNHKREMISSLETRYNMRVFIHADDRLLKPAFTIEAVRAAGERRTGRPAALAPVKSVDMSDLPDIDPEDITDDTPMAEEGRDDEERGDSRGDSRGERSGEGRGEREFRDNRGGDREGGRGDKNRRRRGRGGRDRDNRGGEGRNPQAGEGRPAQNSENQRPPREARTEQPQEAGSEGGESRPPASGEQRPQGENGNRNRRRRGRRGGRGRDRDQPRGEARNGQSGEGRNAQNSEPRQGQSGEPRAPQTPRPDGGRQHGEANGNTAPREARAEQPQAPREATARAPQKDAPQILPVRDPGAASGGDKEQRKGWWKRLTE